MRLVDHHGRPLERSTAPVTLSELNSIFQAEAGGGTGNPAATISWYYSCLTQTARAFAQMPLKLWKREGSGRGARPGFRQIFGHKIETRLKRPVQWLSMIRWLEEWASILLDGGDVFCVPDKMKTLDGITRSLPLYGRQHVQPVRQGWDGPLIKWRVQGNPFQEPEYLAIDEVMHWALPNPYDTIMGLAPKDALRLALDSAFFRSLYEKTFYQKGAVPAGVLINKNQELDEPQREEARAAFEGFHSGPTKAGRLLILGNDWDFKQWALQQSQAQTSDSAKFGREEIAAAFFGFPVGFLNAQENGGLSRAGEEADRLKLYENCAFPLAKIFEPEFNWGFVERVDPRLEAAFDTRQVPVALTYAKAEAEIFKIYVNNGIAVNPVIDALDLPFDPQVGGDVPLIPNTLVPLEMSGDLAEAAIDVTPQAPSLPPPAAPKKKSAGDPVDAIVARLRRKVKRVLYDIRQQAVRDPEQARRGASAEDVRAWARFFLPPVAVAVEAGADPSALQAGAAGVERALIALQGRAASIRFVDEAREVACEAAVRGLIQFLDETLREAAHDEAPERWLASLDRAASLLAQRTVNQAVAAGAATVLEAA